MKKNIQTKILKSKKTFGFLGLGVALVSGPVILSSCSSTVNLIQEVVPRKEAIQLSNIQQVGTSTRVGEWVKNFNEMNMEQKFKQITNYGNLTVDITSEMNASVVGEGIGAELTIKLVEGRVFENGLSSRVCSLTGFSAEITAMNYRAKDKYSSQGAFITAFNAATSIQAKLDLLEENGIDSNLPHLLTAATVKNITVAEAPTTTASFVTTQIVISDSAYIWGSVNTQKTFSSIIQIR